MATIAAVADYAPASSGCTDAPKRGMATHPIELQDAVKDFVTEGLVLYEYDADGGPNTSGDASSSRRIRAAALSS